MPIKNGDTVKIHYKGTLENGEVFDDSKGRDPIEFTVGKHHVVPGFENAVLGKSVGDEFDITIQPSEAYGEVNPEQMQEVPKSELDLKEYKVGMQLSFESQHGDHTHTFDGVISKVDKTSVIIDFNHPLAGKVLNFWMKIEEVK